MDLILTPQSLSLVGNMNHVVISADTDVSFVLTLADSDVPVIQHTYSPNDQNRIEIDLKNIILPLLSFRLQDISTPYQQTTIVRSFQFTVTEIHPEGQTANSPNDQTTCTFSVIRAGVDRFDGDVASFLQQNFLTWQPNLKPVTYYTPEFLTYYNPSQAPVSVVCKAYFSEGSGSDDPSSNDQTTNSPNDQITLAQIPASQAWTVPVQYAVIAGLCDDLPVYYDVWVQDQEGQRLTYIQRYVASDMRSQEEEWILFENSLGGIDTFRAYGDSENTAEHTHNVAEIEEDYTEYRVDTTRKFRKNTGFLGKKERLWMLDFFPSLAKYTYIGSSLRRIVVIDSDVNYRAKELPSAYNFTYKYADARPYLNLPRADLPQDVLHISVPDIGDFTVAPRLVEFPRAQLSGGALFPVQNPYSESWSATTIEAVLEYLIQRIGTDYSGGGGVGHSHPNISLLNALSLVGLYLMADNRKIYAGFADEAGKLDDDSADWDKILRKDIPDTAQALITFLQGIAFGDGTYGIDGNGDAILHDINAQNALFTTLTAQETHFFSLIIDEVKSVGGQLVITPANCTADLVEPVPGEADHVRVFFQAQDGSRGTVNQWEVGDQALHYEFDTTQGTTRNYWRLVVGVSDEPVAKTVDGVQDVMCHWIDLSLSDCKEGSGGVEPGDHISMLGNRADASRQNAIIISAYNIPFIDTAPYLGHSQGIQAPLFASYTGINSFTVTEANRLNVIAGNGNLFSGTLSVRSTLTDGRPVNSLGTEEGNLLRNTAFTGDYESEAVAADTEMTADTPLWSDPMAHWVHENAQAADSIYAKSGRCVSLADGSISQTVGAATQGEWYMLSFFASGDSVTVNALGVERNADLTPMRTRLDIAFEAVGGADSVTISGTCVLSDIILTKGTIPVEWAKSPLDPDTAKREDMANDYLRQAIAEASTTINGGLVLTQMLKMGHYRRDNADGLYKMTQETGGLSGVMNDSSSPYSWGGGTMQQAINAIDFYKADPSAEPTEEDLADFAKFVVTHGGRAILEDVILRGYVYALGGKFKGRVEATEGEFRNVSSPNENFVIDEDGNVTISGTVNAIAGDIGGIIIVDGHIGSSSPDIAAQLAQMSLFNEFIVFNGMDRQALFGVFYNYGTPILCRLADTATDGELGYSLLKKYGIVFDIANSVTGNYAFAGRGDGVLDGMIDGYRLRKITLVQSDTYTHIAMGRNTDRANRVLVKSTATGNTIVIPSLSSVCEALNIQQGGSFAFRLIIMADYGTVGFDVKGRNTVTIDGEKPYDDAAFPVLANHNADNVSITMEEGDILEVLLVFDPNATATIGGFATLYTARIISHSH